MWKKSGEIMEEKAAADTACSIEMKLYRCDKKKSSFRFRQHRDAGDDDGELLRIR